jgi:IS30 family transposase
MAKHMTLDERKAIAHGIGCGLTFAELAGTLSRAESTIANEVKGRMLCSNKGYGSTNRVCEHFETCSKIYRTSYGKKVPFKEQKRCFEMCEEYVRRTCPKLGRAPYVCNGCAKQNVCPLRKRFYIADAAQANYRGILRDARRGAQADEAMIADMNCALKDPILRGRQSIRAVMATKPEAFHGFSERSVYNYANSQLFDVKRGDMPLMCRRKPPKHGETVPKTDARCRVGRTYQDYLSFLGLNFGMQPVEIDTVIGSIGGKVLFTMMFSCGLMLAFLRDAKTSQTTTRIFNMLQNLAGLEFFMTLFPVVLADNGQEFSNPKSVEFFRPNPKHNPTKLERRTWMFFCDPYRSTQKPHVENNHLLVRRIMPKGASFDRIEQEHVDRAMSHINSYPRQSLDGKTPYDEFVSFYGDRGREFLERLNIRRISADCVTLDPSLLGPEFKREANNAILRRKGVEE